MKIVALLLFSCALIGCTTLANRRDLYSPQPPPEIGRPITTTTTTTTTRSEEAAPGYRY